MLPTFALSVLKFILSWLIGKFLLQLLVLVCVHLLAVIVMVLLGMRILRFVFPAKAVQLFAPVSVMMLTLWPFRVSLQLIGVLLVYLFRLSLHLLSGFLVSLDVQSLVITISFLFIMLLILFTKQHVSPLVENDCPFSTATMEPLLLDPQISTPTDKTEATLPCNIALGSDMASQVKTDPQTSTCTDTMKLSNPQTGIPMDTTKPSDPQASTPTDTTKASLPCKGELGDNMASQMKPSKSQMQPSNKSHIGNKPLEIVNEETASALPVHHANNELLSETLSAVISGKSHLSPKNIVNSGSDLTTKDDNLPQYSIDTPNRVKEEDQNSSSATEDVTPNTSPIMAEGPQSVDANITDEESPRSVDANITDEESPPQAPVQAAENDSGTQMGKGDLVVVKDVPPPRSYFPPVAHQQQQRPFSSGDKLQVQEKATYFRNTDPIPAGTDTSWENCQSQSEEPWMTSPHQEQNATASSILVHGLWSCGYPLAQLKEPKASITHL